MVVIKKSTYCPNNVNKELTRQKYSIKEVGYAYAISGVFDGQHFYIYEMKDPEYTMMLVTTYAILESSGNERKWHVNGETAHFKYSENFHNHYNLRHSVDDYNNSQQPHISIEKNWAISHCPNCVFLFLMRVTEVNIFLEVTNIYSHGPMETPEFWIKLAKTLLKRTNNI